MKANKILIVVTDISLINEYKKLGINKYVFPLTGFTVGIPNTFLSSEINVDGYIYRNRILDNKGIDNLKSIKEDILNNKHIKGIIFDDLGVYEVFKDTFIEKILYLTHSLNSTMEVGIYLNLVDSVILSTDLTREELINISNTYKDVSIFTFGLIPTMYSRRYLIKNYTDFHKLEYINPLRISNTSVDFILYESEFGTIIYNDLYLYDESLFNIDCKYYFYSPIFLSNKDILDVLNNKININTSTHFLYKKTTFKVKESE